MRRFVLLFTAFAVISCTDSPLNSTDIDGESHGGTGSSTFEIQAEKNSWMIVTKSKEDDRDFAKDIPWQDGEKVMVIRTDSEKEVDQWGRVNLEDITYMCTVSKANGLKCTLVPEVPLEDGVYQAVYPVYDYVSYSCPDSSLVVHLSFLYEEGLGLDYQHQDIVISDPVTYEEGHKLSFVMKHVCALVDIDIYPPKTGNYSSLKVVAENTVFAGKANYIVNGEYNIDKIADVWFNFTTLRGGGVSLKEGELFHTSTGLLPVQYDGMPMNIFLVYEDGTYYLSETFLMPSLNFGVENKLIIDDFKAIDEPIQGLWADFYMDKNPQPYDILYWESSNYN